MSKQDMIVIDGVEYSTSQLQKIVESNEKTKQRQQYHSKRLRVRNMILLRKSREMGLTVTDEEIEIEMSK